MVYVDNRQKCLKVAHDLILHKGACHYSEGPNRWEWHNYSVPTFPFYGDCSSTFTAICFWGGIGDPNDLDYRAGDTGTLLAHAKAANLVITRRQMLAGDGVLLGWDANQPQHVAYALQPGTVKDPQMFNMGGTSDPSIQPLSVLLGIGAPVTFFRVITRVPVRPKPFPRPVH